MRFVRVPGRREALVERSLGVIAAPGTAFGAEHLPRVLTARAAERRASAKLPQAGPRRIAFSPEKLRGGRAAGCPPAMPRGYRRRSGARGRAVAFFAVEDLGPQGFAPWRRVSAEQRLAPGGSTGQPSPRGRCLCSWPSLGSWARCFLAAPFRSARSVSRVRFRPRLASYGRSGVEGQAGSLGLAHRSPWGRGVACPDAATSRNPGSGNAATSIVWEEMIDVSK